MNDLPCHVAIIMDGNGRWARQKGLPRIEGHRAGAETVRTIVTASREIGIQYLTLYAFSSENWKRPRKEVFSLMELLKIFLVEEIDEMNKNGVRLEAIGRLHDLPKGVRGKLNNAIQKTKHNENLTLILALNYGSRIEIMDAVIQLANDCKQGVVTEKKLTEELFSQYLYTKGVPDPDLLIRTSGERRLSNFLLWQLSYAEFLFTETLWPDYTRDEYLKAIEQYGKRERRFGGRKK